MEIIRIQGSHSLVTSIVKSRAVGANSYTVNCRQYVSTYQTWQISKRTPERAPEQTYDVMTLDYVRIWVTEQEGNQISPLPGRSRLTQPESPTKGIHSMDEQQQKNYRAHVRGAATYVLLGKKDAPMTAAELVRLYDVDLATVTAEIDAIVETERHKVGGVFEVGTNPPNAR